MIRSFKDREAAKIFEGNASRHLPQNLQHIMRRKLRMLDSAVTVEDLRIPPGNRLETLKGSRSGQFSIRINDQWRVCFLWVDGAADQVEIVDYH